MEATFTLASSFIIFVPMPLLIVLSIFSCINEVKREKAEKESKVQVNHAAPIIERRG